jgi:hypothetical protein
LKAIAPMPIRITTAKRKVRNDLIIINANATAIAIKVPLEKVVSEARINSNVNIIQSILYFKLDGYIHPNMMKGIIVDNATPVTIAVAPNPVTL